MEESENLAREVLRYLSPFTALEKEPKDLPYVSNGFKLVQSIGERSATLVSGGNLNRQLLVNLKLDPRVYVGYALGFSLDRLAMAVKGIKDESVLRSVDPRVTEQMVDLSPFVPVSKFPSIKKDLSVAVACSTSEDEIIKLAIQSAGESSGLIESATIISQTSFELLPAQATERLGMIPGQKNVLLRLVFCSSQHTLQHGEVNELCKRIYSRLHEGGRGYLM
jgi:phenylalanyl-tRNA synthetase alpha chain